MLQPVHPAANGVSPKKFNFQPWNFLPSSGTLGSENQVLPRGPLKMSYLVHQKGLAACGLAAVIALLASSATRAATITEGVDKEGNHYLALDGPIVPGDPERFAAAIWNANAHGYRLDALRLNSPGGSVWEAMAIAVMVRWVENIATVVQKDAKCESACFALFAAGHRKYVDPRSDPTQIGVHSIYEVIKRDESGGASTWKESGDTTIEAVRLLREIFVPIQVIGKIVTTPPNKMFYLTISDLWDMGVHVTDHPQKHDGSDLFGRDIEAWQQDTIKLVFLSSAVVRSNVTLNNGLTIPAGTVVVARDELSREDTKLMDELGLGLWGLSLCFSPKPRSVCRVSYHLPGVAAGTAEFQQSSLDLIRTFCQNPK
jgi:hypothetical protein